MAGSITPALIMSPNSPDLRVEAEVLILRIADAADDDRAFVPRVLGDLARGLFQGSLHDVDADRFIVLKLELFERRDAAQQSDAAAGNNAFLDRCAGGVHGVFDASLLLLQFRLGCRADFNDRYAADQLGETLLELFLVVVRGGIFDLGAELLDAAFDLAGLAGALDDRGVVLVDDHFLGAAEVFELHVFELDAEIFA